MDTRFNFEKLHSFLNTHEHTHTHTHGTSWVIWLNYCYSTLSILHFENQRARNALQCEIQVCSSQVSLFFQEVVKYIIYLVDLSGHATENDT